jgi:DNA modification methylase
MDKLKMHSPNLTQDNITRIQALFPNCVTEAKGEDGSVKLAVDFDQLRQELSESIVEGAQERYQLNWPGKREALLTANASIAKTLRPCLEESVDFDTTQNLFIEGDNLDALKLLQETYLGKVKMIYIDPPYNTGNDFIYEDDFSESQEAFLKRSNQKDDEGNRLVANTAANGRFHSDWLSLMYPRLRIARSLLTEDGAIFINIDDSELGNLRKICDEVFGEDNFVANVAWKHTQQSKNDERYFARVYNALLIYRKSDELAKFRLPRSEVDNRNYSNPDNDPKGDWRAGDVRSPTVLTRRTIAEILKGINAAVFAQFKTNPESFIAEAIRVINEQKATVIIEHLAYDTVEDKFDLDIFTAGQTKQDLSAAGDKLQRHIYDYVLTDSNIEREFVKELDASTDVVVYAKLPRGFLIPTPVGDYNPDWAISFKDGNIKHVYFVAETKGSMSTMDLRPLEATKIECARKFFTEINKKYAPENVKYDVVNSFGKLMELVK